MKKIIIMMLAFTFIFTLSACGGEDIPEDRIQIDFWHMSPVGSDGYSEMKALITAFNDSQDEIYVKGTGFSFWDYWDKISISVSGGQPPHIGLNTIDDVVSRADENVLHNITELMANDPENTIDLNDYYQAQLDFATYDGDLYALPYSATTRMLYYNLDMFEAAGLTEEDVPTTWSELYTVAKQLDITDGDTILQLGFDPTYGQGTYHGYLWQAGLDFFDENLDPVLTDQAHADVLQWMVDFNQEYTLQQRNDFGDANAMLGLDPFTGERVAMVIDTDGLRGIIIEKGVDINYGVVPIPVPDENGVRVNWGSGFSIEMFKRNDDTDETVAASFEFLKYLMSESVQEDLYDVSGWIMSNISAMQAISEREQDPILDALIAEVAYARDKVYVPYAPAWHAKDWQDNFNLLVQGEYTIEECLQAAQALYIQKQENYNATH